MQSDTRADIRDLESLKRVVHSIKPDIVLHLAAQPLVRLSFDIPLDTFAINVMGTVNLLEAIRTSDHPCAVVAVTTDKCYENREWLHSYREEDAMGGYDPYSASKGCAELVTSAYRRSFFSSTTLQRIASARAGNVIGGGDWAVDRIVPDVFRALARGDSIPVRNKHATRPWQHVLEPLSGYMWLAANLAMDTPRTPSTAEQLCSAFNFGPSLSSNRTVADVVQSILAITGGNWSDQSNTNAPHEASKLNLAIDKAFHLLEWKPTWNYEKTIETTVEWYRKVKSADDALETITQQIEMYEQDANTSSILWAAN